MYFDVEIKVLRIHYNLDLRGGAENHILKIMTAMYERFKTEKHLMLISKEMGAYNLCYFSTDVNRIIKASSISSLKCLIETYIKEYCINIIHIHSMPFPQVTNLLFEFGLPVFRSLHEPMITCPGWSRFLERSCKPCSKNFGPLCLINAYTEKCQRSRKPENIVSAYLNVYYEQNKFIKKYFNLIVYSDYMLNLLLNHGVLRSKILKVPSPQKSILTTPIQTKSGIPDLVFVGRISKQKGIFDLIEAYREIVKYYPSLRLKIIGDGDFKHQFEESVEQALLKNIQLLGWQKREDIFNRFASDCVVVVPSIYPDNFPNVVAEAMLNGAPVVASNSGGTSEWFIDGESGISYEKGNINQLVKKIVELIESPSKRAKIGIAAKDRIERFHSYDKAADRYAEVYSRALT
ncbi:glycosyltransferase family 4 protein [Acaryochloris marina]|uniref:glycosyltransferase family 4 protein n=1 Tax=Acaryochloris marina TaxID=155978 RepID=UPI001BAEE787|nr:glycosyltransferase family 4 protein [Acaryochloris marina]QUY40601.1 glycosyltransferase family 4 protein [Acaryochloris marina S15]